jgi:branched-chain amino acid transport system substrate-binding protein
MNLTNKLLFTVILLLGVGCKDSVTSNQTPETIKLGAVFSLSGHGIKGGTAELRAVQMALEDINEKGGIAGKSLEVIFEDNHSDLKTTATVFKKLIGVEKVPAIIGPNWVEFTQIVAPIAENNKVVMISASGMLPVNMGTRDFVFSLQPTHEAATHPLAKYLISKKYKSVALIKTVNAYYEGIGASLLKQLAGVPGMKVEDYTYNSGEFDYRTIISKFKKEKIEAIVVFMLEGGEHVSFLKQLRELNYDEIFFLEI